MLQNIIIALVALIAAYIGGWYLWDKKYRPRRLKRMLPTRTWSRLVADSIKVVVSDDKEGFEKMPEKFKKWVSPKTMYAALLVIGIIAIILKQMIVAAIFLVVLIMLIAGRARTILGARDVMLKRMFEVAHSEFKYPRGSELNPWAFIRVKTWETGNHPGATEVVFPASFRSDVSKNREDFEKHFNGTVAEKNTWVYTWEGAKGIVSAKPVPPLPTMATYPGSEHVPWNQFPLGQGANGEVVWDVSNAPHILVCGTTGGGKSVFQRNMLFHTIQHSDKWIFLGVDVKMVELPVYAKYDSVVAGIAADVPDGLEIIRFGEEEMMNRYDQMKQYGLNHFLKLPDPPKAILIMIDETYSFLASTGANNDEGKELDEMKAEATVLIGNIARLGRAAGVHLVIATQRPDAKVIPGELKENLAVRYAAGRMKSIASQMVLDTTSATEIGDNKGRGMVSVFGDEQEIQGYFAEEEWIDEWLAAQGKSANPNVDMDHLMPTLHSDMLADFGEDGEGSVTPPEGYDQVTPPFQMVSQDEPAFEQSENNFIPPAPEFQDTDYQDEEFVEQFTPINGGPAIAPPPPPSIVNLKHGAGAKAKTRIEDEWDTGMEGIFDHMPNQAEQKTTTQARKTPTLAPAPPPAPLPSPPQAAVQAPSARSGAMTPPEPRPPSSPPTQQRARVPQAPPPPVMRPSAPPAPGTLPVRPPSLR